MNTNRKNSYPFVKIGPNDAETSAWVMLVVPDEFGPRKSRERFLKSLLVSALLACLMVSFIGCSSEITGGQARREKTDRHITGATETALNGTGTVVITPDGITVTFDRHSKSTTQPTTQESGELVATTQPSGRTNTGQNLGIGGAKEGELGGISLEAVEAKFKNAWWLGLILIAASAPFWYLKRWMSAGALAALGFLTILYPLAVVVGAILFLGLIVWAAVAEYRGKHAVIQEKVSLEEDTKDIVNSVKGAINQLDPVSQVAIESKIGRDMDKKTKRRVSDLKNQ